LKQVLPLALLTSTLAGPSEKVSELVNWHFAWFPLFACGVALTRRDLSSQTSLIGGLHFLVISSIFEIFFF